MAAGAVTWGYASRAALEACRPTLMFERMEDVRAGVRARTMVIDDPA